MPYTDEYVNHVFSYHPPTPGQPEVYETIRNHAREFFKVINQLVPDGADKADSLRSLRNCVMTANAGIALAGGPLAFTVAKAEQAPEPKVEEQSPWSPYQTTTLRGAGGAFEVELKPEGRSDGYVPITRKPSGKSIDTYVDEFLSEKGIQR